MTREYNQECSKALVASIDSFFSTAENIAVYKPSKLAKFNIAISKFTKDTNQAYARCAISDFTKMFAKLTNFSDLYEVIP